MKIYCDVNSDPPGGDLHSEVFVDEERAVKVMEAKAKSEGWMDGTDGMRLEDTNLDESVVMKVVTEFLAFISNQNRIAREEGDEFSEDHNLLGLEKIEITPSDAAALADTFIELSPWAWNETHPGYRQP